MSSNPFDAAKLFKHVQDAEYFHLSRHITAPLGGDPHGHVVLPQLRKSTEPLIDLTTGIGPLDDIIGPLNLRFTKFMALELVAAVLLVVFFCILAARIRNHPPKGRLWNFLESMLLFIRDQVARPAIGKKESDRYLPYLWTIFFFVLACNLLGMIPWLGSPTGSLATTGALALMAFLQTFKAGVDKMGVGGFFKNLVPHMDLPRPIAIALLPMIFAIELFGLIVKHCVLAIRLLANIMAGHLVLAVVVAFIGAAWYSPVIWGVAPASIVGATALSLLELFVAFLQAYVFTFLSALFIGMAVHEH